MTRSSSDAFLSRRAVVGLIPILAALHNGEEGVTFRSHLPTTIALLPAPWTTLDPGRVYSALVVVLVIVSVLVFLLAVAVTHWPSSRPLLWLLLAIEATLALNSVWHLVMGAVVFHGYAPGVITAVALNAPFAVYCFVRATRERWLSLTALRALVPAAFVLHGPVLFGVLWLAVTLSRA